jgi:hypothetical protein
MTKAEEILEKYPSVKLGLDDHYGKQTVLNALNEALRIHDVVRRSEQLKAFLTWLEKEGGSPFIDKDALIDDWLKSL